MKKPNITKTVLFANWIFCFFFLFGNLLASNHNHESPTNKSLCELTKNKALTLGLTLNTQDPSCFNFTNGAIYTEVSGGVPPYYYLWDDETNSTAPHLLGVGDGTYTVTITDSANDIISGSATLFEPTDIIATMTATDANCAIGGTASVTVSGGVGPYTYLWDNGSTDDNASDLQPGLVSVFVTDFTGCVTIHTVSVGGTSSSSLGASIIDQEFTTCDISSNGYAEVAGVNGSGNYTYLWPNGQITALANNLDVGTYIVTVTDDSGCTATTSAIIELHPDGIVVSINGTDATCAGNDGSANSSVMLGNPPYAYTWSNDAFTSNINNLIPDTYSLTVTDSKGCSQTSSTSIDSEGSGLSIYTTSSFETCSGSQDASATVVASGGNPPYVYTWSNGYVGYKNPNLSAGTYEVTVVDSDACQMSASETVEISPEGVWLMLSGTDASCCGNDGTAHVSIMTGDAPFVIEWSDGQTGTEDPIGLPPGEICVTVSDANGCSNTECITLEATDELSIDISPTNASCSTGNTGSATATPCTSGTFTYSWSNGQTTQTATNLANGDYQVTVENSAGCYGVETLTIVNEGGNLAVQINNSINVSCFGGNDGSASVSASGGSGNYSYTWSNGQSSQTATGLSPSVISVVITDNDSGCSGMASVNISQPSQLNLELSGTDISCGGSNNGTATATVSGGTAPYTYSWDNNNNGPVNNMLSAGTYTVTTTDANNCSTTGSINITEGSVLIVSILDLIQPSCFGLSNGGASASATGGNLPYTYLWNNAATTGTISGIAAGSYSVTITDIDGCSGTASATIDQPDAIDLSISSTNETCGGGNDGTATATVSGGTPPYSYLWNNGQTSADLSNLAPGNYMLTLSDASGCTSTSSTTTVEMGTSLNVTTSPTFVSCNGASDGSITANVSGGSGNYTYIWDTGATTAVLNSLIAGTYMVTVSDDEGCSGTASGIILEPTELSVVLSGTDESCTNASNGEVYATPSGGTAPYTYAWNTGANSPFLVNLSEGTFTVTVTDANNCTTSSSFVVNSNGITSCSAIVSSSYNEGVDISTLGGNDGTANASVSGGASPVTYNWSNGQNGADATGLSAGTYTVTVADASGCTCTSSVTLLDPAKLGNFAWEDLNKNGVQNPGEPGIEGVKATLTGTTLSGSAVMRMMYTGATGMYMFDGLPAGTYKVTFEKPDGYNPTSQDTGVDESLDSDANEDTGMTGFYTLTNGDYDPTVDAGFYGCVNIGDFVWYDLDKDGIQNINDGGFPNVLVRLFSTGPDGIPCNADDYIVDFETTNTAGNYQFECVEPGEYYIQFVHPGIPSTYTLSPSNQGSDDSIDSDPDPTTGKTSTFTIVPGQANDFSFDAGISPNCNNVNDGGMIGYSQTVCAGFPVDTLINTTNPNGGSGDLEYIWLKSITGGGPVGGSEWEEIPNSNTAYYYPGTLIQTTLFVRCARRVGCNSYFESNFVQVEIIPYNPDLCGTSPMIMNFTGSIMNEQKDLELNWSTNEENDIYNFYVEYSFNNENFESIGNVNGAGLSTFNNHYSFIDNSLKEGAHYYRIKAIGLQTLHYSNTLTINIQDDLGGLTLYPNPSNDVLNIEVAQTLQVDATIEIYNSIGQLIDILRMTTETNKQVYDLNNLSIGTYFVRLNFDDSKKSKVYKFLKR